MRSPRVLLAASLVLISAILLAPASASGNSASASIVNGKTASIAQFPWLAHIDYIGASSGFECSGTVVAPRLVLTAGHCVASEAGHLLSPGGFRVTTGLADLKQAGPANLSEVVQVLAAPGFNLEQLRPDAALLVLAAPVSAPGIALAGPADAGLYNAGTEISIAGWGLTDGRARESPTVLREGATVVQSAGYCQRKMKRLPFGYSNAMQLCAIEAPRFDVGSCHGDSGGPSIAIRSDGTPVQIGVISFGSGDDCSPRSPEGQTRVDGISAWIAQWIGAIEYGGVAPAVVIPKLTRLPALTIPEAKYLDWEILAVSFGQRFLQGKYKEIGCRRLERTKVKCLVFWYHAKRVYTGSITTYLALPKEGSLINYRFRIRRVGAACWLYSRNPKTCPGTLFYR